MTAEAAGIIADGAAMLAGRAVDSCPAGMTIPGWVRVNQLAHAGWADLACLADSPPGRDCSGWNGAIMFLAEELRITAGTPEGLRALQQEALIPLELDLLDGRTCAPRSPMELVDMIRTELARVRRRRVHLSAGASTGPRERRISTGT